MSRRLFLHPHRVEMPFESPVPGDTSGVAVFDVEDEAEVQALVAADPAVVSRIMKPELRPLRISVR